MKKKQVMLLSDKYILRRWTKNAKVGPVYDLEDGVSHGQSLLSRHGMLTYMALELVEECALTDARINFLMDEFRGLKIWAKEIDDG